MKKIVCFHLLNDYSGSPKVLQMVIDGFLRNGYAVDLVTSHTDGVLSQLDGRDNLKMRTYKYQFSTNRIATLIRYSWVQIITLFMALKYIFQKDVVFYINTILPVCPALIGRMMGKKVVYHYHENAHAKGHSYRCLAWWMQKLADNIICVSEYQKSFLKRTSQVSVVSNAIPESVADKMQPNADDAFDRKMILMLGSLKRYKGAIEFIKLATMLPSYRFTLVINDTQNNINRFIDNNSLIVPPNINIYPRQTDIYGFYNQGSIVLNLSNKNLAIETFGLTVLEAMVAGLPVIVPTVGGIAEMVEDGVNGYKIDVQELDKISDTIVKILSDKDVYTSLSKNALRMSRKYNESNMINQILKATQIQ